MRYAIITLAAIGLASCSTTPRVNSWPAAEVVALAETEPVGTTNEDAADDPAIWRNSTSPADSLIVATDKRAGLHVYGLDGKSRFFEPSGRLNNVDLAQMPDGRVIVVASDRNDPANALLRVYELNTSTARLTPLGTAPGGSGEAYGVCIATAGDALHAFSVLKDGTIEELRLTLQPGGVEAVPVRTRKLATQSEGCVVDPRDGTLYVGEEGTGIWRFAADEIAGELVAPIDNLQLVADVEGLALVTEGQEGGWLVASSQGDNAYAVFSLPDMTPAGRFRIAAGTYGSTEETDGIALHAGSFGPSYPDGLFVAQDGLNAPGAQNFKLVSWSDIREALAAR